MARKRPGKIDKVLAEAKALLSGQYAHRLDGIVLLGYMPAGISIEFLRTVETGHFVVRLIGTDLPQ